MIKSQSLTTQEAIEYELADGTYATGEVEYADDVDASWMSKGDKLPYGYSATVVTDEHGDICCYACGAYQRDGQICRWYGV